jgi:hypothetical protein
LISFRELWRLELLRPFGAISPRIAVASLDDSQNATRLKSILSKDVFLTILPAFSKQQ